MTARQEQPWQIAYELADGMTATAERLAGVWVAPWQATRGGVRRLLTTAELAAIRFDLALRHPGSEVQ